MRFQSEKAVFNFLWRSVEEKHFMRLQSENAVFKFFRRSVNSTSFPGERGGGKMRDPGNEEG